MPKCDFNKMKQWNWYLNNLRTEYVKTFTFPNFPNQVTTHITSNSAKLDENAMYVVNFLKLNYK